MIHLHSWKKVYVRSLGLQVTIVRNGKQQEVSTADLVVGDVLLFGYGDILAVDGVLIQGDNIR